MRYYQERSLIGIRRSRAVKIKSYRVQGKHIPFKDRYVAANYKK